MKTERLACILQILKMVTLSSVTPNYRAFFFACLIVEI